MNILHGFNEKNKYIFVCPRIFPLSMQLQSSHPESCGRSGHPLQLYRRVQKCSVKDTGRSENEIKDCHRRKCHHQLWQDKNPYRPAFPAAVLCRRGSRSLRCPFCTPRTRAKMGMKKARRICVALQKQPFSIAVDIAETVQLPHRCRPNAKRQLLESDSWLFPCFIVQSAVPFFGTKNPVISARSSSSSLTFLSTPPAYPVRLPFVPTTR